MLKFMNFQRNSEGGKGGWVISDLEIFFADLFTYWGLYLTKIKYAKETYVDIFTLFIKSAIFGSGASQRPKC